MRRACRSTRLLRGGAREYLTKPVDVSQLLKIARERRWELGRKSERSTGGVLCEKEIFQSSRILIIDDRAENVLLLERMLSEAGYQYLRGITDSRQALNTFTDFEPDLVAIDLRMPHVDGFALLKQFRSRIPEGT